MNRYVRTVIGYQDSRGRHLAPLYGKMRALLYYAHWGWIPTSGKRARSTNCFSEGGVSKYKIISGLIPFSLSNSRVSLDLLHLGL